MALTLAKTCTKVGLSGGAIYWSIQQGVWGTTQEGSDTMKRFTASIRPETSEVKQVQQTVSKSGDPFLSTWNQGTKTVFEYVRDVPEYAGKAKTSVSKFLYDSLGK